MISEEYIKAWRIGNDKGNGYAVGDDDMSCSQAAEHEGYTDIEEDETGQVLATDGEDLVVIRDANGPWAVRIPASDLQE